MMRHLIKQLIIVADLRTMLANLTGTGISVKIVYGKNVCDLGQEN